MKTKEPVKIKKQTVTVKDLKTKKNPKGGGLWDAVEPGVDPSGSVGLAKAKAKWPK